MTRLRPVHFVPLVLLSVIVTLSACDLSSVTDELIDNTFSLTISPSSNAGDGLAPSSKAVQDQTIDGYSFFYDDTNPDTNEQVFAIYFTGGDALGGDAKGGLFGFLARNSDRPDAGQSYTVVQQDQDLSRSNFVGALYEEFGNGDFQGAPYYLPTSGTVTIDESSSDEVAGSVDIEAYKVTVDTTEQPAVDSTRVDINGEFTARDVNEDQFLGLPLPSPSN
ncbi:MAG TPA: hypothetical protein VJ884_02290 [Salinibacter sp.]|nr:hypothetical protein [Salinibacter sp.]